MMMQENRELKQKFDKIQSSAEGLAKDLRAMGEAAQVTGKASLSSGGKTLYPQNYGLKIASLLSQVEKLDKELHKLSAESGVELLDTLKELSSVLRTTSNSFAGITGFSNTLDATLKGFDAATKAAARATNAYAERIRRRGGIEYGEYGPSQQKLLPGRTPGGALAVRTPSEDPYKVIFGGYDCDFFSWTPLENSRNGSSGGSNIGCNGSKINFRIIHTRAKLYRYSAHLVLPMILQCM